MTKKLGKSLNQTTYYYNQEGFEFSATWLHTTPKRDGQISVRIDFPYQKVSPEMFVRPALKSRGWFSKITNWSTPSFVAEHHVPYDDGSGNFMLTTGITCWLEKN